MTKTEAKWVLAGDPKARAAAERVLEARRRVAAKKAPGRAEAKTEKASERAHRAKVYALVDARSGGQCEVTAMGQRCRSTATEHDHFYGRGKAEESAETVWHLCSDHHRLKTENDPTRERWLKLFRWHCLSHRMYAEAAKCDRAIALEIAQHPERP